MLLILKTMSKTRRAVAALLSLLLIGSCLLVCELGWRHAGREPLLLPAGYPAVVQTFSRDWTDFPDAPDGVWRVNGDWNGVLKRNARVHDGKLLLTTPAESVTGAELQTREATFSHGYYEVRMQVTHVAGVCQSFFWKSQGYDTPEIDIEFLTGGVTRGDYPETWVTSPDHGRVHVGLHPSLDSSQKDIDLPFNPSLDFHNYGFLWTTDAIIFTVDRRPVAQFTKLPPGLGSNGPAGYIMANSWAGAWDWGGGPPTEDATASYDWVAYYPGSRSIPR